MMRSLPIAWNASPLQGGDKEEDGEPAWVATGTVGGAFLFCILTVTFEEGTGR